MRILSVLTVGVALLTLCRIAPAAMVKGQATPVPHPTLSVTGEGTVEVAPDTARVTASIITEGESVEAARERNAQIAQKAMAAIKALNLPNAMTKTLNYTMERVTRDAHVNLKVDPDKWDLPWKISGAPTSGGFDLSVPVTLGYRASNSLTVRLQGMSRDEMSLATAKVIDTLMSAGANQITSVEYTLEKETRGTMRDALTKAVKDAQKTAEAVAEAAGRKIVGIDRISPSYSSPGGPSVRYQQAMARDSYSGEGAATLLTAGMLQVKATVQITYQLDYNAGDTELVGEK